MVSIMETHDSVEQPKPRDAERALSAAADAERAARSPRLPVWYYPIQCVLVGGLFVTQMLDGDKPVNVMMAIFLVQIPLNLAAYRESGVSRPKHRARDYLPFVAVLVAGWVVCALVDRAWLWVVGAVLAAGWMAFSGWRAQRAAAARPR